MMLEWYTKLDLAYVRCPIVYEGHPSNFKVTRDKKSPIFTRIESFRTVTSVWTDGYEMMHKAWSNIKEVPYCFPMSFVKFQGHTAQKIADSDPNWAFPNCDFSWNSPTALKWCTTFNVASMRCPIFFMVIHQISRSHGTKKIPDFDPNWVFPDCNSSLHSPRGWKWCTELDVVPKRCHIIFRGHPSNFKVTRADKSTIWIQFE